MSQAETSTIFLVIGARHIECVHLVAGRWQEHRRFPLADGSMPELLQQLQVCGGVLTAGLASGKHDLRVLVADVWLAEASVFWSEALRHQGRAHAFVRLRMEALGCDLQDDDVLRLDDAPYGQPRLAVAYPAVLINSLAQLGQQMGARLNSLLPLGVAAWETLAIGAGQRALAVQDEGMIILLHGRRHLQDLNCRRTADGVAGELAALWRRLQLRDIQLAALEKLPLLDLAPSAAPASFPADNAPSPALQLAAAARTSPLDAIAPVRRRSGRLWLLAGGVMLATLTLLLLAVRDVRYWMRPAALVEQTSSVPARTRPAPLTARESARVAPVNAAVRALNQPIIALLRALEPPPGLNVALLGLDIKDAPGGKGPRMQLTGLAKTPADMSHYLRFLAAKPTLAAVYLTGHEIIETRAHPYRFTLEATWAE